MKNLHKKILQRATPSTTMASQKIGQRLPFDNKKFKKRQNDSPNEKYDQKNNIRNHKQRNSKFPSSNSAKEDKKTFKIENRPFSFQKTTDQSNKKNKIIFDKKLSRKERKQEYIRLAAESKRKRTEIVKKSEPVIEKEEPESVFIIKHGKISKETKNLITGLKFSFQPHSNLKFEESNTFNKEIYKNMAKMYKIRAFFIFKETKNEKHFKLHDVKNKQSHIFKILDTSPFFVNKKFDQPALLSYSNFTNLSMYFPNALGKSTFIETENIKRVLNFSLIGNEISLRHFEITIKETRCTKVGLKELGPKIDFQHIKSFEGDLDERW
ncbi:putative Brix domain protein [Pseudoloma neurophilia]|uniref:Putative Brix domain protein n=1 Tax=Pseudoloma neurophilia TaxID=146866 RepID=A0A0R0M5I0_9MICR|nr:putative Brix domain protein [Pseudoloma neurophilia]